MDATNDENRNNNPPADGETPDSSPTPFSPEELLEQVNDQLEGELEKIDGYFTTLLAEVKNITSVPPTAEQAPPASDMEVLRALSNEVSQTCSTYEEFEPQRNVPILDVPLPHVAQSKSEA